MQFPECWVTRSTCRAGSSNFQPGGSLARHDNNVGNMSAGYRPNGRGEQEREEIQAGELSGQRELRKAAQVCNFAFIVRMLSSNGHSSTEVTCALTCIDSSLTNKVKLHARGEKIRWPHGHSLSLALSWSDINERPAGWMEGRCWYNLPGRPDADGP